MQELIDQLPSAFDIDESARNERLRRRLAGVLRQLDRRIGDCRAMEEALAAERAASQALAAEVQALRAEIEVLRSDAEDARQQYHYLLGTKTFRLVDRPRRVYGRILAARRHLTGPPAPTNGSAE